MLRRLLFATLGLALLSTAALGVGTIVDLNGLMYSLVATPSPNTKVPAVTIVDANGNAAVASTTTGSGTSGYPAGATPVSASSAIVGAAAATATLAGVANKTTYITGFTCSAAGSTAALAVDLTVTGALGGTIHNSFVFPAGVGVPAYPMVEQFIPPLPASAVNTSLVVSLPSGGAGNVSASCNAQGYQQ